jgi:hypothetical protein
MGEGKVPQQKTAGPFVGTGGFGLSAEFNSAANEGNMLKTCWEAGAIFAALSMRRTTTLTDDRSGDPSTGSG